MRLLAVCALAFLSLSLDATARQAAPPRDARPPQNATGTARIRGRVIAADTRRPLFGVSVQLSLAPPDDPREARVTVSRQATTDMRGAFAFTQLPEGQYRLIALPGVFVSQYVRIGYGATHAIGDGSKTIAVGRAQTVDDITIALPRGGVISGTVADDAGTPFARAAVVGLWFAGPGARGQRFNAPVMTDDLGHFRLFGLLPGEYVVVARTNGSDGSDSDDEPQMDVLTTYYPGTIHFPAAQRVRVTEGRETTGIDFRLVRGRTFQIRGAVTDAAGRPAARVEGRLVPRTSTAFEAPVGFFMTDDGGTFAIQHVQPGAYWLAARQTPADGGPGESPLFASALMPIEIANADAENIAVALVPPATITGRIVFEEGPPPSLNTPIRVYTTCEDTSTAVWPNSPVFVGPDLTFKMTAPRCGSLLRVGVVPGWWLKAIVAGREEITDVVRQFAAGDAVTIVLTSRASTLRGRVANAAGEPLTAAGVLMFGADPEHWFTASIYLHRVQLDSAGRFKVFGLKPGAYYIIAGPRARVFQPGSVSPSYFEAFVKDASRVVIGENEEQTMTLQLKRGG